MPDESRREPFRDDLCRSAAFDLIRANDEGSDGLTIEGYGAVFNAVTEINSWEGTFEEEIAPGAFKKSLRERGAPRMQFDHGRHPLLGSLPLGLWSTAEEDERGLHLSGRLFDNWLVRPFRDVIRDGGVEGMSFRFSVVRDEWRDKNGKAIKPDELLDLLWTGGGDRAPIRRTLREVKVSEAGPVVWPAYEETSVGVRNRGTVTIDLARLGEPEQRRALAEAVALADEDEAAARLRSRHSPAHQDALRRSLIESGYGAKEARRLAARAFSRDETKPNEARTTETVDTPPPAGVSTAPPKFEPQPTDDSAGEHPAGPRSTGESAGEHSSPARPRNPRELSKVIKAEYREIVDRLLAIPKSSHQEGPRA